MADVGYKLGAQEVFILLFVMLGPIKLLGPFARATASLDEAALRAVALRTTAAGTLIAIAGGFVGRGVLGNWEVPILVLQLAAGLIFFVVAFQLVLQVYEPAGPPGAPAGGERPSAMQLVFPLVLTPHGIAAVIVLLALSRGTERTSVIVGMLLVVMLLNLLAMRFVRPLLRVIAMPLQAFGAVLGVLQVALALQIMLGALHGLGVLRDLP
jgi:multiple antibiotic resistance protein